jgi:chromosome segregation ATPase
LGWFDGIFGSTKRGSMPHELMKFKERAELAGRDAASWWAEKSAGLTGECDSLTARLDEATQREERLGRELTAHKATHGETRDDRDEARVRSSESDLDRVRRERRYLTDQLKRAEAQRESAYHMARESAKAFKQHYESLIASYCAANRKMSEEFSQDLPDVGLPHALKAPSLGQAPVGVPATT